MKERIHFLNTGHSDCIIIESEGKIAMIDAAEDNDYPPDKPFLKYQGYEDIVVDYLIRNFSDKNGKVSIEFVLGTHAHSDHIGGFDTVINHPDISVKTAYLKPYHEEGVVHYERRRWDNVEVYTQMLDAIKNNGVKLIESFDRESVYLGKWKLTFFNGEYKKRRKLYGENINSVVTLAEVYGKRFLLAGDMNYMDGDEKEVADAVGKVDVLKVGHHGYIGSTSLYLAKKLNPDYAIVCNWSYRIYPDVKHKLKRVSKSKIIATADVNGVLIEVEENSDLFVKTGCM
ncbi:MAG: MBL fold metallo-hydrolase [Eubacterium sp.]|nr:MBL fold metallo-hydrolase [Eubacterium sp.]